MSKYLEYTFWRKYEAIIVFVLAASVYMNALYGEFLFDDIVAVCKFI